MDTVLSLDGGEPEVASGRPPARTLISSPGSADTHPFNPRIPSERPPPFFWLERKLGQVGRVLPRVCGKARPHSPS